MRTRILATVELLENDINYYEGSIKRTKEKIKKAIEQMVQIQSVNQHATHHENPEKYFIEQCKEEIEDAKNRISIDLKKIEFLEEKVKRYRKMADEESEKETPFVICGHVFSPTPRGYYCQMFGEHFYVYTKQCGITFTPYKKLEAEDGKFYGCVQNRESIKFLCKNEAGEYVLKEYCDANAEQLDNPEEVGRLLVELEL